MVRNSTPSTSHCAVQPGETVVEGGGASGAWPWSWQADRATSSTDPGTVPAGCSPELSQHWNDGPPVGPGVAAAASSSVTA